MNYKDEIVNMITNVENQQVLVYLYNFIKAFIAKH